MGVATALREALLAGQDERVAQLLVGRGWQADPVAAGIVRLRCEQPAAAHMLLSVAVHGDETVPVALLATLLQDMAPQRLAVEVLIATGNPAAAAAGQRYLDADLNRMFRTARGIFAGTREAARADVLIGAVDDFFADAAGTRWHLDLHSTIRASVYPAFALLPHDQPDAAIGAWRAWLAHAALPVAVLTPLSSGTFSAWTAGRHGAVAATLELGRAGQAGGPDAGAFAAVAQALEALLCGLKPAPGTPPLMFRAVRELIKHSDDFRPCFDSDTVNFTRFEPGSLLAEDSGVEYRAGDEPEYILFPNAGVQVGMRAGVMVVAAGEA